MAAATSLLSEDQFLCSICLNVFTDPVTTPCGHNFCKNCITEHWDVNFPCRCPICNKFFHTTPELQVNTLITEMVALFRQSAQQRASSSSSEQQAAKPGEVPCDICTGTKLKALKSCLVCLVSYCETHLEPHVTASGLKKHQMIDPAENLEGRMCTKHDKLLELFCKVDQACICVMCTAADHRAHAVVPLKEECEVKKAELEGTEAELQKMIQERQLKIQEIKRSAKFNRENADREIAVSVQVFTNLIDAIQRQQAEVTEVIEEKHRKIERQAEGFIAELEKEIFQLKKKSSELKQLSHSEDHINFLQNFSSQKAAPSTRDWKEVSVCPPTYVGMVRTAVAKLMNILKNKREMLFPVPPLNTVQQFAVDVTLDPDTANPFLVLSDDGKQVHHGDAKSYLPDKPERFSTSTCVAGKQSFSSGRFYFEVQVKGKTKWALGVARESMERKGKFTLIPKNGYWTVCLRNETYCSLTDTPVCLRLRPKPEKVGVFVDYEEDLVSFYDVDSANLIYTFTGCSFTQKLFPIFSPGHNQGGENSAPLIICPVVPTE